ncbi:MAG: lipopolysaccharide assembly protein LapA domain-containing protein [Aeromicrobium sp.]
MTSPLTPDEPDAGRPTPSTDGPDPAPEVPAPHAAGLDSRGRVKATRASGLWIGLISAAVLAVLFLIFIAQNSEKVTIHFLGLDGELSLAISLLLSAVIGALVVAVPGIVRISQLRHALRKNAKS